MQFWFTSRAAREVTDEQKDYRDVCSKAGMHIVAGRHTVTGRHLVTGKEAGIFSCRHIEAASI